MPARTFNEDVFVVVRIFGQQQLLQCQIQRFDFGFRRFDFFGGKVFHFGVGQHFLRFRQIAFGSGIGAVGFHNRGQLGVLFG